MENRAADSVGAVDDFGKFRNFHTSAVGFDGFSIDFLLHIAGQRKVSSNLHVSAADCEHAFWLYGWDRSARRIGFHRSRGIFFGYIQFGSEQVCAVFVDVEIVVFGCVLGSRAASYHKSAAFGLVGLIVANVNAGVASFDGEDFLVVFGSRAAGNHKTAAHSLICVPIAIGTININLRAIAVNG